ncbi:TIGR03086 family metal-binding protein [Nocardia sp. NPDC087230]|uniref:TIGR03086 family metal-binding protein n=1 Tax=Nocardia sp. NPDC087230 TaxID=3364331 RepID=UPI00381058A1
MHTISEDRLLLARHQRAVRLSVEAVEAAADAALTVETPCAGWDLRALLEHMGTQNRGFAAAARGADDPAVWEVRRAADPVDAYLRSADEVVTAFAEPGAPARTLALPEIPPGRFPAPTALGFHLVDSVVHAWDVARSVGRTVDLDPDLAATALRVAMAVPIGKSRERPGAAFAPALDVADDAATLDRILRVLGRSPDWRPSHRPGRARGVLRDRRSGGSARPEWPTIGG